jgi:predicted phosphodiesterase
MKVALLSDIHGNSAAVRAALAEARKAGAEELLILGDLVGYYYDIRGVLDQLVEWPRTVIGGNHEGWLARARTDSAAAAAYRTRYGSALDVACQTLDTAELDWLAGLPPRLSKSLGGTDFELCHGAPDDRDRYVYPNAADTELAACEIAGRMVLMGHTHYPMISLRADCTLINPGSVGQARDLGGFAAWMLVDTQTGVIAPRRTAYDAAPLAAEARHRDPGLPYLWDILSRNRIQAPQ